MNKNLLIAASLAAAAAGTALVVSSSGEKAPFGYCTMQPMDGQGWCRRAHPDGHTSPFPETLVIAADAGVGHCAAPFACAIPPEYDAVLMH